MDEIKFVPDGPITLASVASTTTVHTLPIDVKHITIKQDAEPINKRQARPPRPQVVMDEVKEAEEWVGSRFETAHNVVDGFVDRVRGLDNAEEIFTHWFADAVMSVHEDLRAVAREHMGYLKSREA